MLLLALAVRLSVNHYCHLLDPHLEYSISDYQQLKQ